MEIFGGFMVMMSIISLFLAVVWLIMPFVVFAIKGKQDRTLEVLETIEKRLATIETSLQSVELKGNQAGAAGFSGTAAGLSEAPLAEDSMRLSASAADNNDSGVSPVAEKTGGF